MRAFFYKTSFIDLLVGNCFLDAPWFRKNYFCAEFMASDFAPSRTIGKHRYGGFSNLASVLSNDCGSPQGNDRKLHFWPCAGLFLHRNREWQGCGAQAEVVAVQSFLAGGVLVDGTVEKRGAPFAIRAN